MITHTISLTELIWTLFCSVGLIFNGRILLRAVGDWNYLRERKINSLREYAAILTIFTYATWTTIQLSFVFVGVYAMTQPPTSPTQAVTTFSVILTSVFISISILMAGGAAVNEVGRRRLITKLNKFDL